MIKPMRVESIALLKKHERQIYDSLFSFLSRFDWLFGPWEMLVIALRVKNFSNRSLEQTVIYFTTKVTKQRLKCKHFFLKFP